MNRLTSLLPRFRGLRFEILGNLAVVSLISLLLTGFGVWAINGRQMVDQEVSGEQAQLARLAVEIGPTLTTRAAAAPEPPSPGQAEALRRLRQYETEHPRVRVHLVDPQFRVWASTQLAVGVVRRDAALAMAFATETPHADLEGGGQLLGFFRQATLAVPIVQGERLLGGVLAELSLDPVLASARRTVKFLLIYMGMGTVVLLLFGTILLSRTLVRPLDRTMRVMQCVADGDLQQTVPVSGENEMGLLARTFNTMAEQVRTQQKTLNEHVKTLRRMNKELKESQREVIQSEKLASVGLLAAGVAHEVGNPLGALLGYLSMLKGGEVPAEEHRDYLDRMERDILRIDRIVRDLREYSRPSPCKVGPSDINRIVLDTVNMIKRQLEFREIHFELSLDDSLPDVLVDTGQLQQVLVNLFLNAKDAMERRGSLRIRTEATWFSTPVEAAVAGPARRSCDPPGVDFRLLRKDNPARKWTFLEGQRIVLIHVEDDGAGVAEEHLGRVFDPFFTTKEAGKGTGLGLSVSQRIVESFHGDMEIESQVNAYTRLRIRLPAAQEILEAPDADEQEVLRDGTTGSHR